MNKSDEPSGKNSFRISTVLNFSERPSRRSTFSEGSSSKTRWIDNMTSWGKSSLGMA